MSKLTEIIDKILIEAKDNKVNDYQLYVSIDLKEDIKDYHKLQ